MNGGLSQVDSFDPKPMLDKYHGQPLPGGSVATERKTGTLMQSPFTFKKYGKSGIEVSELFPARRRVRGRHLLHPLGVHRHPESRAVDADDEHRPQPGGPAVDRVVADLRTGHREQESARRIVVLCPDVPTTVGPPLWNNAFLPAMHQGTYHFRQRIEKQTEALVDKEFDPKKADLVHPQREVHADRAAARARSVGEARPDADGARVDARSAARGRHQVDGDGLPDADRGAGRLRHSQGKRGDAEAVRTGQHGARMPDGGATGGERRAHGAGLLRQGRSVGRACRYPGASQEREGFRSAVRGGDQGSEVARPVQGHAGGLRIGVRAHAGGGDRRPAAVACRMAAITIHSGSPCGWRAAASRAA